MVKTDSTINVMKTCQKCETQNPDENKFCKECGAELIEIHEIITEHKTKVIGTLWDSKNRGDLAQQKERITSYCDDKGFDLLDIIIPTEQINGYLKKHDEVEAILFWNFNYIPNASKYCFLQQFEVLNKRLYTNGEVDLQSFKPYKDKMDKRSHIFAVIAAVLFISLIWFGLIKQCPKEKERTPLENLQIIIDWQKDHPGQKLP
jgi:hypothetical protein